MDTPSTIQKNIPLAPRTTLGVGGNAEYFAVIENEASLREVLSWAKKRNLPITVLGTGSNVLIRDNGITGLVLAPNFLSISYQVVGDWVHVTAGAGVILDCLIAECVAKGLWGLENLSAIPGTVGAVPIQNVGAYGVEASDVIRSVTVYDRETDTIHILETEACAFAYRDSIFKHPRGASYIVLSVTYALSLVPNPKLSYKDLVSFFVSRQIPSLEEIRNAVIEIRSKKFPDWHVVGTAGSFFKNPIITHEHFVELTKQYPELPGYATDDGRMKVSLGWILDNVCNLKGYTEGKVKLYEQQALVLVCEKGTSATHVENFSNTIIERVREKTGIVIEREVTLLG